MTENGARARTERIAELAVELQGAVTRQDWRRADELSRELLSRVSKVLNQAKVLLEFAGDDR